MWKQIFLPRHLTNSLQLNPPWRLEASLYTHLYYVMHYRSYGCHSVASYLYSLVVSAQVANIMSRYTATYQILQWVEYIRTYVCQYNLYGGAATGLEVHPTHSHT